MPEITAARLLPVTALHPAKQEDRGCLCHCREATQEVDRVRESAAQFPDQEPSIAQTSSTHGGLKYFKNRCWYSLTVTMWTSLKWGVEVFDYLGLRATMKRVTHTSHTGGEKNATSEYWGLDFLLLVYLFNYFCRISCLSPRSEVWLKYVFPHNKGGKKIQQWIQGHFDSILLVSCLKKIDVWPFFPQGV